MVRKSGGVLIALSGLALVTYYFWYSAPGHVEQKDRPEQIEQHVNFQEPITPIPLEMKLDARKVALGRRLFHDPRLSHDNTVACSNCHNLANGGMDGLPRSSGIAGKEEKVNTLTVFNSGFNFRMFWDGRVATLEDQIDFPMNSPCEMGSNWDEVIAKLGGDADYRRDFKAVYPDGIGKKAIKDVIATFERSLTTPNGKFDRFLRGDKNVLDGDERAGYELFKSLGCISCHQGRNVGGNMYEKIGVVDDYFAQRGNVQKVDFGRYNITGIEEHRYEFRVPSLRNVALTAPYFHDASAKTLEQAVTIMGKYQLGVKLTSGEVTRIVKFLNTLTGIYDEKLLVEPLAIRQGGQTALHSHSAKSPKDGDISRWLTPAKSLVMSGHPQGDTAE
ncbi:MAG: cytochrome c peroxidase [Gallionella sp.]